MDPRELLLDDESDADGISGGLMVVALTRQGNGTG
jgi:hypothetical protein